MSNDQTTKRHDASYTYIDVTIPIKVIDARAMRQAVHAKLLNRGLPVEDAAPYLDPTKTTLLTCATMLLDPGVSPPGTQIIDSVACDGNDLPAPGEEAAVTEATPSEREKSLATLAESTIAALSDLEKGYPWRELHIDLKAILAQAKALGLDLPEGSDNEDG